MEVLFFVMIFVGILITLGSVGVLADSYSEAEAFGGFLALIVGIAIVVGGFVGAINKANDYDQETVRLCDAKHGVVSKDDQCFVDGKPVEFSPGVWKR